MNPFKLALAAFAATFTLSSAHAEIKQHRLTYQGGLPAMIMIVGAETPISAYTNPDHADLVRFAWTKTDGTDTKEGTYEDYYYCDETKPNQEVHDLTCYAEYDERSPMYQLLKNDPGMGK